ncbi:MAG: cbb3-type cytochrome c oxidase N-terminal domain-containing protein [Acidobacteriota bacterium]
MSDKDQKPNQLLEHEADGIREFDNALPKWWLYGFYFTIAFAVVYVVNYHMLTKPMFGQTSIAAEYQAEMAEAARIAAGRPGGATGKVAFTDAANLAAGEAIFMGQRNLCHTCHRKDLGGLVGPNLTDELWRNGCAVDQMVANVKSGFPPKGMLPFGSTQRLTDQEVLQVVSFVISKRGSNPKNPKPMDPERDKPCTR